MSENGARRHGRGAPSCSVRLEHAGDAAAVRAVHTAAFGGVEEADLVDALRTDDAFLISLVGEAEGRIAGHVLFSRMWIDGSAGTVDAVALAPVGVLPAYQRRGIGELLIRQGLELLQATGEGIVIVVGHADYYPRFGFSLEMAEGLDGPFPRDVFMAMELQPGALDGVQGRVRYAAPFGL